MMMMLMPIVTDDENKASDGSVTEGSEPMYQKAMDSGLNTGKSIGSQSTITSLVIHIRYTRHTQYFMF